MATTLSISPAAGFPTSDAMRVDVSFTVTYAASYYTYFELYDDYGDLVDEAHGNTYTLDAGGSKSGIYKTFYGLEPNTTYTIVASLWNASTDTRLSIREPSITFTTEPPERPSNWYWTSTVSKGAAMRYTKVSDKSYKAYPLTASEWNNFINRIFEFLEYMGYSISGNTSNFYVTSGTEMRAETVDYARQLIEVMSPPIPLPTAETSGDYMTAAYINGLRNSLNSIE